ncbi:C40 family peptidase [Bacillus salipaludis]|uniref:NlpC/P60 family protein n=1 Tax=Bacillus salipaludis TaxID=2547811 RepID=A0AA90R1C6_9BACI|nr:C40 family peptidase [Bacillus salipaludis]MDQ6598403.1 NlpC/P60 family protein [Bacillus salipaludis]
MIRFMFIMLSSIVFLAIGTIPKAFADTELPYHPTEDLPPIVQNTPNDFSLKKVNQSIQKNKKELEEANLQAKTTKSQVKKLKKKILQLKDSMKKRNKVLKERAKAYQQNGGNLQYLDVLLGSTNIKDFVERAGAVSTVVIADKELLNQQAEENKEYENKKHSLKDKLAELDDLKASLTNRKTELKAQREQYKKLAEIQKATSKKLAQIHKATSKKPIPKSMKTLENFQTAPVKGSIQTVIKAGYKYIGNSVYIFGGGRNASDIANGWFDCSGFVHWAFGQAGIEIGSSTDSLKNEGKQVPFDEIQPGDLVFFDTYKKDGHVGIYIGNGKFIGSQNNTGVAIEDLSKGYWKQTFNGRVVRI